MTKQDLHKRAAWLNGVAGRVTSPEVSKLLRQYARDLTTEAEFADAQPASRSICGKARLI